MATSILNLKLQFKARQQALKAKLFFNEPGTQVVPVEQFSTALIAKGK